MPEKLRHSIRLVFFLMLAGSIVELASIFSLTLFFRLIYSPDFVFNLPGINAVMEKFPSLDTSLHNPLFVMQWACMLPIALILLKNMVQFLSAWQASSLSANAAAFIGNSIIGKYLGMPYDWHISAEKGALAHAMQGRFDVGSLLMQILQACSNIVTVAILFGGLFIYAPEVSGITAIFMFCAGLLTYIILKKRTGRAGEGMASESKKASALIQKVLDCTKEIIIFQKQDYFLQKIGASINAASGHFAFLSISPTIPTWILECAGFFLLWLTVYFLKNFSSASHAEVSATIALLALTAWRVLPAMNRIVGAIVSIRGLRANAMNCLDYLNDLEKEQPLPVCPADSSFKIMRHIAFDNVSYAYKGAEGSALSNVSCSIPQGSIIGMVGKSGSGKSTFINILCGLLEPDSGSVLADGKPMTKAQFKAFRQQTGYVSQKPGMFGASITKEIGLGDWGQQVDRERIQKAIEDAAINFIADEPDEFAAKNSVKLSGGQAQRVAIARALYSNPDFLVLDEPDAGLDQATENVIRQTLLKAKGKKTVLIATHRLESLEICDIIFWFDSGRLIASGSAPEILRKYKEELAKTNESGKV